MLYVWLDGSALSSRKLTVRLRMSGYAKDVASASVLRARPGRAKAHKRLFEALNRRRRGQLGRCGWRDLGWCRSPRDSRCLRTCRRRNRILANSGFASRSLPSDFPRAGPSKSPGMRNGGSSGIANHGARDRAHRAEHHRARYGAQGGVATAPLGPALCRRERQGDGRREEKSFHLEVPTKQSDGARDSLIAAQPRKNKAAGRFRDLGRHGPAGWSACLCQARLFAKAASCQGCLFAKAASRP